MQSGFPTASLPRGVDTASNADRPAATSRPSATSRRDDGNEPARDSAFSDMVAASRQSDETAGSKPAGRSKSGEGEAVQPATDAAPSGKSGNGASRDAATGKTGTGENAASATGGDAPGNGQATSGENASRQQGATAQAGASGTAAAAAQTSAQATGQATGQTSGQAGGPALTAEAATAPRSSADAAGEPAPKAATRQTGQASQAMQTPGTGNKGTAPDSGAMTGSSASAAGSTGSAAADQAGASQDKADARMSAEPSRTPAVITTAGTGETGTTTARSGVSLPDAASPAGQTAASQAGQAAASQAPQVRNAQAGNDPAPVAGKPASAAKSGNQGTKPAPAPSSATNTAADATGKTAGPGRTDAPAPLRDGRETRAILETGNSGGLAGSARKTASAKAQGDPSASSNKSGTTATAVPNTTEVRPDPAAIQLPRETAPGNPSPLGQLLAANGGAGDISQPLQTVETDMAQADAEIQLNRAADARAGADRAGGSLPRFAPHTAQQLAGQITRNFNNGQRVFDIRLDPAELGKVDVRLELRADNRVHAVLTAERPETLAELQRAARDLERSLNEAGLELAEDGLSFQMSEDGQTPGSDDDATGTAMPIFADGGESGLTADTAAPVVQQSRYGFLLTRREGVDMRV